MKISQDFINNLSFKGGWKIETLNNKSFYVLTDPDYCQIFWLEYWYNIGINAFHSQNHIQFLNDGDLRTKVILDPINGDLLMPPQSWNLIFYLGNYQMPPDPPIIFYVSPNLIILCYTIFCIVALIIYFTFSTPHSRPF